MPREFKTTEDLLAAAEEKKLITRQAGRITYNDPRWKNNLRRHKGEENISIYRS